MLEKIQSIGLFLLTSNKNEKKNANYCIIHWVKV